MTDTVQPAFPAPVLRAGDQAVIDLLRVDEALGIGELAASLRVTATAVRQRLERLMREGIVERSSTSGKRGRPAHAYRLTTSGRRMGGDNFHDLALVLWREIRGIRSMDVRRGLLGRIGASLAGLHRDEVQGSTPRERLGQVAAIMRRSDIACTVDDRLDAPAGLPVLTSYACPYPDLAEQDRGICAAERTMIEDLVGCPVRLSECRLDGGACCRFSLADAGGPLPNPDDDGLEPGDMPRRTQTCAPDHSFQRSRGSTSTPLPPSPEKAR